jgi:exodeoxyribonuclease III (xth)
VKIISFNINSVRARLHQVQAIIEEHNPDVIGLQETKVHDDQYPFQDIEKMGFKSHIHGQKAHYGVALLFKKDPIRSGKGFKNDYQDSQKRFIWAEFKSNNNSIFILNGYFPQGEERDHPVKFPAKRKFFKDLINHLQKTTILKTN